MLNSVIASLQETGTILQNNPTLSVCVFTALGLCVGSFLNVVIHRIPLRMHYEWRQECSGFLSEQTDLNKEHTDAIQEIIRKDTPISLSYPASRCPNCGHQIKWYENIPLLSWLILLKAKCSGCSTPISARYPLIEIVTAALSAVVILTFGVTAAGISALVLVWTLVALTGIDFDTQLLPDRLTYPLAGLGLFVNLHETFVPTNQSVYGLLIGFLSLWSVNKLFYLLRKQNGMGAGDFKLLAALGAWLGVNMLLLIILLSSVIGAIVGGILMKIEGESRPFAFGPYIAMAGIVALLFGTDISAWYLGMYKY